ncbi:aminodeoxychorismate lyase [Seongchinamella sediminis]|uniref:aminodeoxychorismate lyase n=1 Tax=Seongchinamella sediminis TaxID=2283635 RepID=UPI0013C2CF2E|nr:aminodeoxychorismate lyase [Seongchinamella sediminis]
MSATALIWVDGERASALPLPDRGLDFGDGLFETLLLRSGTPQFQQLHLERLAAGLQVLSFPDCLERAADCLQQAAEHLQAHAWAALRLTVTRGAAPRGYAPPAAATPRVVITAAPLSQDRSLFSPPLALDWAHMPWSSQPQLAGIKHLNRLEQVLVAARLATMDADELVVLDQQGQVCSVSAGNLFLLEQGRLLTPALETCGIAGTRRRLVLEQLAPALSIPVAETHISPAQLADADAVFVCNSIRGLQPVASLGERRWHNHELCHALHEQYLGAMSC